MVAGQLEENLLRSVPGLVPGYLIELVAANEDLPAGALISDPVRRNDSGIGIEALEGLLEISIGLPGDPAASDGWLAPRVHSALRLTRREASDPGMWRWLSMTIGSAYLRWRWASEQDVIAPIRVNGGINKQALARLWWSAELLRNGGDYTEVGRFLSVQDFPNSLLHRPVMRFRAFALALVAEVFAHGDRKGRAPRGDEVNAAAEAANLFVVPRSLAALTVGSDQGTSDGYWRWLHEEPPGSWAEVPVGPPESPVASDVLARARELAVPVVAVGTDPSRPLMRKRTRDAVGARPPT